LPAFYWWSALGGVLGGAYVNWLAPRCFQDYYELELAALLTYAVLLWARVRQPRALTESAAERRWLFLGFGLALPLLSAAMLVRTGVDYQGSRSGRVLERRRSWFGALRVTQLDVARMLTHGRIRHGMQLADPARAQWPTMYFGPGTAVAQVLSTHGAGRPRRLGVVGLGVGTLAVYGRRGDDVTFYELDPDVLDVAQRFFSFLRESPAHVHFVLGDGRLSLARSPAQHFDALVLDAFASDAVPAHLLTREAFAVYTRHLAPDGVLLANVSNRHLAVDRVVRAAAAAQGLTCAVVQTPSNVEHFVSKVRWAIMTRTQAQLAMALGDLASVQSKPSGPDVLWTDARASLWSIVK
jgi:SAM-dependent methyltransferase